MKLYRISQTQNPNYDTYDSAIVCADSEEQARNINPEGDRWGERWSAWCKTPDDVSVELIGTALDDAEPGIVLASFNAG
jgi:hypothetical protein